MLACVDRTREGCVLYLYVYLYVSISTTRVVLYMYIWPSHTLSLGALSPAQINPDPDPDLDRVGGHLLLSGLPRVSLASLWLHSQLNRLSGHRGLGVL